MHWTTIGAKRCSEFFWTPLEQVLKLMVAAQQQWIESIEQVQTQKGTHKFGNYLAKQQFMQRYLIPVQ